MYGYRSLSASEKITKRLNEIKWHGKHLKPLKKKTGTTTKYDIHRSEMFKYKEPAKMLTKKVYSVP